MLLLVLSVAVLVALYWIPKTRYEKTDYYVQTHNSFLTATLDTGVKGEYLTWKYLHKLGGYKKYLFNCYLPKDDGETTEVDVILLHESGIYVFESKNYSGWIFGAETQQYWTQTLPKGHGHSQKNCFFNPIIQNKVHMKWLSKYLDRDLEQIYSYIVFSDRCTLKNVTLTSGQHHVINRYDILAAVNSNAQQHKGSLSPQEIDFLFSKLEPLTHIDKAQKLAHIEDVQKKRTKGTASKTEMVSTKDQISCPRCGGKLVLRVSRKGANCGKKFWGCSNYPKCKYIKNVEENAQ